jgi:predicted metalloprotease with PDZ domain
MISNSKALCLALAIALGSGGLSAAETDTMKPDEIQQQLREAQRQLAEVGKRVAELSAQVGGDPARVQMFRYLGNPDRAVIGVILGDGSKDGMLVQGVTPGGPADKAGLRAGDTITAVRGTTLSGGRSQSALRDALKDLKEGDQVALSYRRDGKIVNTELSAARQGSVEFLAGPNAQTFWFDSNDMPGMPPMAEGMNQDIEMTIERSMNGAIGDNHHINIMAMAGLGGLRLSSMNEGLGRYFGVNEGALVLEVNSDYAGLQAGDVILEIDGKKIVDPRDAMRELSQQDPTRPVELKLQRDRVPQLVQLTVPEKNRVFREMTAPRAPHAMPHPSAAPAPAPPPRPRTSV